MSTVLRVGKSGTNLCLLLPKEMIDHYKLKHKDTVELDFLTVATPEGDLKEVQPTEEPKTISENAMTM